MIGWLIEFHHLNNPQFNFGSIFGSIFGLIPVFLQYGSVCAPSPRRRLWLRLPSPKLGRGVRGEGKINDFALTEPYWVFLDQIGVFPKSKKWSVVHSIDICPPSIITVTS
jgi:hypothetical protein